MKRKFLQLSRGKKKFIIAPQKIKKLEKLHQRNSFHNKAIKN